MADGIVLALDGAPDRGMSVLLQASSVLGESGEHLPLPEAPAVLAAQVALNAGELGIAADVLRSALEAAEGGPAFRGRLRLTLALVALRADRPARARALLGSAEAPQRPLGLRDEVLAHAVRIGIARRTDDLSSLVHAWSDARQTVARMPIDLIGLPALAEFAIAAARLQEAHFVASPSQRRGRCSKRRPAGVLVDQPALGRDPGGDPARRPGGVRAARDGVVRRRPRESRGEAARRGGTDLGRGAGGRRRRRGRGARRARAVRRRVSVGRGTAGGTRRRPGRRAPGHAAAACARAEPASRRGRARAERPSLRRGRERRRPGASAATAPATATATTAG